MRKLLAVLMAFVLMFMLVGCTLGGTGGGNTDVGGEAGGNGNKDWNSGGSSGKVLFDKREGVTGTIHVFYPGDPAGDADWQAIIEGFKKEYPGTKIKVTTADWGSRDIKLAQLIRSGDSPDYVPTGINDFPKRAIKGLMMPLDEYIQVSDRLDTYSMENYTSWDGHTYALIANRLPACIFYNTTMLKNSTVAESPKELMEKNEWTWDAMRDMARQLVVDNDRDGKADVYGFGTEMDFIFPLSRGTDIVQFNGAESKLNIDDQTWRDSLLYYYDGINKDKIFSPVRWGLGQEFINGNVAMVFASASLAASLEAQNITDWDIVPFPKYSADDEEYIGYINSDGFGVAAGAKNPIGGLAFGEYKYNYYTKQGITEGSSVGFSEAQKELLRGVDNRVTWLYGFGMESSFCQSFGNYMRANGDFTALMEEMRPTWQKNLNDTLKGR